MLLTLHGGVLPHVANTFACLFIAEHNYDTHTVTLLLQGALFRPNTVTLGIINNAQKWEKRGEIEKSLTVFALEMMNN